MLAKELQKGGIRSAEFNIGETVETASAKCGNSLHKWTPHTNHSAHSDQIIRATCLHCSPMLRSIQRCNRIVTIFQNPV